VQQAWALLGKLFWLLLVVTGVALVWKWAWGSVSGGALPTPEGYYWGADSDGEPWVWVPPPM